MRNLRLSTSLAALSAVALLAPNDGIGGTSPTPSPQNDEEVLAAQTVDPADPITKRMNAWLSAVPLFIDNGYTVRALLYGIASACTRQVEFIEERLQRGNAAKLRSLLNTATAIENGATDLAGEVADGAAGVNEHSIDEQIAEIERRMEQNEMSVQEMKTLSMIAIKHHDAVSIDLGLPVWATIQAGGANKAAAASGKISPRIAAMLARLDERAPTSRTIARR